MDRFELLRTITCMGTARDANSLTKMRPIELVPPVMNMVMAVFPLERGSCRLHWNMGPIECWFFGPARQYGFAKRLFHFSAISL
jgi:hypothetical protein